MIDNLVKESNAQAFQKEFGLDFAPGRSSENNAKSKNFLRLYQQICYVFVNC